MVQKSTLHMVCTSAIILAVVALATRKRWTLDWSNGPPKGVLVRMIVGRSSMAITRTMLAPIHSAVWWRGALNLA